MDKMALIFMGSCLFIPMLLPFLVGIIEQKQPQKIIEIKTITKIKYIKYPNSKINKKSFPIIKNIDTDNKSTVTPIEKHSISKEDAIECLLSLGLKKSFAKKRVDDLFLKNKYSSLEEFLVSAYKI